MRYYKEFFCVPRLTINAISEDKSDVSNTEHRPAGSWATHFASHLPKKQHFTDLAITSTYLKMLLKRLGARESLSVLNEALFTKNFPLLFMFPVGEGWEPVTSSTPQTQETHLSNSGVPDKRGIMGGTLPPSKDVLKF